ncbi:hypothetical protein M011DRAFT_196866 [Sporormia fimetaria CBS 119925]|uniref:C2H2-type domain-containing protein n=1 Tax=Sporormia fimetaria CBS 119925 TaxID=1340428 RepID=A0A6A6V2L1_9PLEO|nr:hypothetical protein M011DRAFT_196866 [Sporormia fimetaria CBS 119925]
MRSDATAIAFANRSFNAQAVVKAPPLPKFLESYTLNAMQSTATPTRRRERHLPRRKDRPDHPKPPTWPSAPTRSPPRSACPHCSITLRGEHELKRHLSRAHTSFRKAYICINGSSDPDFFANCKFCMAKKVYAVDYNAAAHLRRRHFRPFKREKGEEKERKGRLRMYEKFYREFPMEDLKGKWIREVVVDREGNTRESGVCDGGVKMVEREARHSDGVEAESSVDDGPDANTGCL